MRGRVIIIGGGLAGITAALAVADAGGRAVMIDKSSTGLGTNSAMANAYFTGPTQSYPPEAYVEDTIEIGYGLNRRAWVERVAQVSADAVGFIREQGLSLSGGANNYIFSSTRPERIRGFEMMKAAAALAGQNPGVERMSFCRVLDLLQREGRVVGVRLLDRHGRIRTEYAGAVILAAGGAGAIWRRNDNVRSQLGQGYFLAAQAGLALMDMEFVQFYPLVIAEPGLPSVMLYPPYPKQSRLLAADGRDILREHGLADLDEAIMKMRDTLSALLQREAANGPVRLDFRGVPDGLWERYPMAMLSRIKFDFRSRPVSITPGAHFMMGGVYADADCRTELPGLLACGEMLWGLHGANRRGGNALMECLVSGLLAGRAAWQEAAQAGRAEPGLVERTLPPTGSAGEAKALLRRVREIAWSRAGVLREAEGLAAGLSELNELGERFSALPDDSAAGLAAGQNLSAARLVLEGVLMASLAREETRGALVREDFAGQDDAAWLRNSRLTLEPATGRLALDHLPVGG